MDLIGLALTLNVKITLIQEGYKIIDVQQQMLESANADVTILYLDNGRIIAPLLNVSSPVDESSPCSGNPWCAAFATDNCTRICKNCRCCYHLNCQKEPDDCGCTNVIDLSIRFVCFKIFTMCLGINCLNCKYKNSLWLKQTNFTCNNFCESKQNLFRCVLIFANGRFQ